MYYINFLWSEISKRFWF